MGLEFSRQIFEKCSNIKFHEHPSSGSRVVPRREIGGPRYYETNTRFSRFCELA